MRRRNSALCVKKKRKAIPEEPEGRTKSVQVAKGTWAMVADRRTAPTVIKKFQHLNR